MEIFLKPIPGIQVFDGFLNLTGQKKIPEKFRRLHGLNPL
jgi:hypothetical protein